jgi:NTE family protein
MDKTEENQRVVYPVGLTLSGGGALGIFHIGVLRALEEMGLEPDIMSGTSAGALASALYAHGLTPAELLYFVKTHKLFKTFIFRLPQVGLTDHSYLRGRLAEVLGRDAAFEDLKLPIKICATNLLRGKAAIFDSGPLLDVVCASCAVPFLFKPVIVNEIPYLDGGINKNLPAGCIRKQSELLIGVDLHALHTVTSEELTSLKQIVQRTVVMTLSNNTKADRKRCDVVIKAGKELRDFSPVSIKGADEMEQMGFEMTLEQVKSHIKIKKI